MTAATAAAQSVGIVVDRGSTALARAPYVHVIDPGAMQVTASVPLPLAPFAQVFDAAIAPDLGTAYVSDFLGHAVWVIDLTQDPPALAGGINPIVVTANSVQDIALTPDGRFLITGTGNELATAGGTGGKMTVVDLATRTQVDVVDFSPHCPIAVDAGPDGSVVVSVLEVAQPSFHDTDVRRFTIDGSGQLTDTTDSVGIASVPGVQNLLIPAYPHLPARTNAILSQSTVHVSRPAGGTFGSLRTQGLSVVESHPLGNPSGIDACFDAIHHVLYVRSNELGISSAAGVGNSRIDGYYFLPFLGTFGPPVMSVSLERRAGTAFGVEQTAVDPGTRRLFVSGLANGEVRVFDSITAVQLTTITHPDLLWGVGIAVARR
ncbi:MAG TPA: hypothetical protein VF384_16320 [Planctomycetota bacterium]